MAKGRQGSRTTSHLNPNQKPTPDVFAFPPTGEGAREGWLLISMALQGHDCFSDISLKP